MKQYNYTYVNWKKEGLLLYENKKSKLFDRVLGLIPKSSNDLLKKSYLFPYTQATIAVGGKKPLSNNKPSTKMEMKAYPNPNNGHFDVVLSSLQENTVLELYDMTGRKVHSQPAKSENNQIDVSSLNTGAYILIGRTADNAIGRLKVVIE